MKYIILIFSFTIIFLSLLLSATSVSAYEYGYEWGQYQPDSCYRHRVNLYDVNLNPTTASTLRVRIFNASNNSVVVDSGTLTDVQTYTSPCLDKSILNIFIDTEATKSGYGGQVNHRFRNSSNGQNTSNGQRLDIVSIQSILFSPDVTLRLTYPANNQFISNRTITRQLFTRPYSGGDIDYIWDDGIYYIDPSNNWVSVVPYEELGSEASPYNAIPNASGIINLPSRTIPNPVDGYYAWYAIVLDQDPPWLTGIWQSRWTRYWAGHVQHAYFHLATDLTSSSPTINGSLIVGQNLTFSSTIGNVSAEIIARGSTARFRIDLGNNGTWDTVLGTRAVNQLTPSATQNVSSSTWTATSGTHRIEICADYNNILYDLNRSNNCVTTLITIPASGTNTPTPSPTRTPTPAPTSCITSCTVVLTPNSSSVTQTQTTQFEALVSPINACGNTVNVLFSSSDTSIATISPANDSSVRYQTSATGASSGTSTLQADVQIGGITRCSATATVNVGALSCSFDLLPANVSLSVGGASQPLTATNITSSSGIPIDRVEFSSSDPTVATVTPAVRTTASYSTNVTGLSVGSNVPVTADMYIGGSAAPVCSDSSFVTVTGVEPWWQAKNSDVITNGPLSSVIPSTCTAASGCVNTLIAHDTTDAPGVVIAESYPASMNPSQNPPYGWNVNADYGGSLYSYAYFEKKASSIAFQTLPVGVTAITSLSDITSLGSPLNGYYWVRYDATATGLPLTINGDLDFGSNKVVLFVKGADLIINGKINVTDGTGSFMVVTERNIVVNPSVGGAQEATPLPDLEGVFFAEQEFRTGTSGPGTDTQLHIRGPVAAMDEIVLERDTPNNATEPAELFEFAPDQLLFVPSTLGDHSISWGEVAT